MYFSEEKQTYCYNRLKDQSYFYFLQRFIGGEELKKIKTRVERILVDLHKIQGKKNIRKDSIWIFYEDSIFLILFKEINNQRVHNCIIKVLFKKHFSNLKRIANRDVKGYSIEKEEIPAQTFADFFEKMQKGDLLTKLKVNEKGQPTLSSYLFKILRYKIFNCIDKIINKNKEKPSDFEKLQEKLGFNPGEYDNEELEKRINRLYEGMTTEEVKILMLKHVYGYSYEEISTLEGKSITAVKQRGYRVMKKARRILNVRKK